VRGSLEPGLEVWTVVVALLSTLLAVACGPTQGHTSDETTLAGQSCLALQGQTIRWIVPSTPGGGYDVYARLIEPSLEQATGAEVTVENRPGAAGLIAFRTVLRARPDGLTLGIVNGSSLLIRDLIGSDEFPVIEDFTVLGRVAAGAPVLFTGADSSIRTADQWLTSDPSVPLVFAAGSVGSTSWTWAIIARQLLGLSTTVIYGYPGTRNSSMALIRGDVDLAGYTFDSMRDRVVSGALRPLAVLSDVKPDPMLADLPSVVGEGGLAVQRARALGRDPEEARALAAAWDQIFQTGRLVVAPPDMPPALTECLRGVIEHVLQDSAFVARAGTARRALSYAHPRTLFAMLEATAPEREVLGVEIRRAAESAQSAGNRP
jgi:tripartite-type tricarboxylate transporter receptor subunit TctC